MSIIFIITKYLAFIALSGVSMLLSYNMFSQLSSVPVESALLSVVAIAIEALKIFSLVRGNTLNQLKLKTQAIRAYSMYAILALLAVLASYGYTLTVVDRGIRAAGQSDTQIEIEANRDELEIVEEQIDNLDRQIETAVQRQEDTPFDFITAWRNITDQINQLEDQKAEFVTRRLELNREYSDLRTALSREQTETRSTVNMFRLMAESFGVTETFLMLVLLLSIAILIELGIISTSPTIPIDKKHIVHILNEFAHNLHLDELEAERALEKAKRQQHIHKMYEDAGLQDPNVWPIVDRRAKPSASESAEAEEEEEDEDDNNDEYEPNENLRKLMANPLDPSLPDDAHAFAHTPEEEPETESETETSHSEDISFFDALKTVLFKKSEQQESEHHEDEESQESLPHATTTVEPNEEPLQKDIPVRQIHRPAPTAPPADQMPSEEEDDTLKLTPDELDQLLKNVTTTETDGKAEAIEDTPPVEPESTPEPEPERAPEPEPPSEAIEKPEESKVEEKEEPKEEPKPRRTRQVKKREKKPEASPRKEGQTREDKNSAQSPQSSLAVRSNDKRTAVSEETSSTSSIEKDKVDELHVGAQKPTIRTNKPQEVGETKTYRFGKTTPEVKRLFVVFIEALFKENGEEYLLDPAVASREAKVKPALGSIFIHRLEDLKGSTGLPLVSRKEDGLYYPNYTKEYIISYATKEINTQGRAV